MLQTEKLAEEREKHLMLHQTSPYKYRSREIEIVDAHQREVRGECM
jgi:hypothetical protein